jgi:hypothetical protein
MGWLEAHDLAVHDEDGCRIIGVPGERIGTKNKRREWNNRVLIKKGTDARVLPTRKRARSMTKPSEGIRVDSLNRQLEQKIRPSDRIFRNLVKEPDRINDRCSRKRTFGCARPGPSSPGRAPRPTWHRKQRASQNQTIGPACRRGLQPGLDILSPISPRCCGTH